MLLKRLLAICIAVCYLCVSTGFSVDIHYCMGKFAGISLSIPKDRCSRCGMSKNPLRKGCCKDEHRVVKSSYHIAQVKTKDDHSLFLVAVTDVREYQHSITLFLPADSDVLGRRHGPPTLYRSRIYAWDCAYLI